MNRWLFAILGILLSGNVHAQGDVTVKKTKDGIDFLINGELATRYQYEGQAKPVFWPIYAPGNVPLTRAWPLDKSNDKEATDHPHQKSVWFCHGDVIPEGLEIKSKIKGVEGIDFWTEGKGRGVIVCTEVGEAKTGKNSVQFSTKNEWRTAEGVKILDETRGISFHDFGKARLLVLDIDLHASTYPITFGDTKEGCMGIRISEEIIVAKKIKKETIKGKGQIQNAEGKVGEDACWGNASAWCDYSGPIGGKVVGLAVLADPKNSHASCWHSREYGLMAANPFGRNKSGFPAMKGKNDLVKLAKGEHLHLRFGVLAHEGDTMTGRVAEFYQRFVDLAKK